MVLASLEGKDVVLVYPEIIPAQCAQRILCEKERGLRFVESVLGETLEIPLRVEVRLVLLAGSAYTTRDPPGFVESMSSLFLELGKLEEDVGSVHEETHVVASVKWGGTTGEAAREGLAVMVDSWWRYPSFVDYHLICKGLQQMGTLFSIQSLLSTHMALRSSATSLVNLYLGGASLSQYLVQEYGMEQYSRFYQVSGKPFVLLLRDVERMFGCSVYALEDGWHRFLEGYAPGQEDRAELALKCYTEHDTELDAEVERLENLWEENPHLFGASGRVYEAYRDYKGATLRVAGFEAIAGGEEQAENDFASYLEASARLRELVRAWEQAAAVFASIRGSIPVKGDDGSAHRALVETCNLYVKAGDTEMSETVSSYLALQRRGALKELLACEDCMELAIPALEDAVRHQTWSCE